MIKWENYNKALLWNMETNRSNNRKKVGEIVPVTNVAEY